MQINTLYSKALANADWQSSADFKLAEIPLSLQPWLIDKSSMTKRLQKHCQKFSVEVLQQIWQKPLSDEIAYLKIHEQQSCLIREVNLYCNDVACIFGRTVMPESLFQGKYKHLQELDSTPIGEILFADPEMQRSDFEFAKVKINDDIFYARRSIFYLADQSLMLTEIFLGGICQTSS